MCGIPAIGKCTELVRLKRSRERTADIDLLVVDAPHSIRTATADANEPPPTAADVLRTPADAAPAPPPQPSGPGEALRLAATVPGPSKAKQRAAAMLAKLEGGSQAVVYDPTPGDPIPYIDPKHIAELKQIASEIQLDTTLGPITLVAKRTRQTRLELTYEEAATLTTIVAAFPGSKIVSLVSPSDFGGDIHSQLDPSATVNPQDERDSDPLNANANAHVRPKDAAPKGPYDDFLQELEQMTLAASSADDANAHANANANAHVRPKDAAPKGPSIQPEPTTSTDDESWM